MRCLPEKNVLDLLHRNREANDIFVCVCVCVCVVFFSGFDGGALEPRWIRPRPFKGGDQKNIEVDFVGGTKVLTGRNPIPHPRILD